MTDRGDFGAVQERTSVFTDLKDIGANFGKLSAVIAILTAGASPISCSRTTNSARSSC